MGAEHSQPRMEEVTNSRSLTLSINDVIYHVNPRLDNVDPSEKLVDYIRNRVGLTGTKVMCREGGCGACLVAVRVRNLQTGETLIRTVNSCLVPLMSCDGWDVITVEGLGSKREGLHPIQDRLVKFGGTQCGFCTPGMVMAAYNLTESRGQMQVQDIEDCLDGNICRCTGYRQIVAAFQSLAVSDPGVTCSFIDCKLTDLQWSSSDDAENSVDGTSTIWRLRSGQEWVVAGDMNTLSALIVLYRDQGRNYKLVAGNTGTGVFKKEGQFRAFINIGNIPVLSRVIANSSTLTLGATTTISMAIDALNRASQFSSFAYASIIAQHLKRVANTGVRNIGTLGGNLMLKHQFPEFPSDVFLVLATVGAQLNIALPPSPPQRYSLRQFLALHMSHGVILSITFPSLTSSHRFRTFRVSQRYQNSHAYVNAGFLLKLSSDFTVVEKPSIVFGGISPSFVNAEATENFIQGRKLTDSGVFQACMKELGKEVTPAPGPGKAGMQYRKQLAQSLFYKFIIGILGTTVTGRVRSAGEVLSYGVTSGSIAYDTDKKQWPLYQPVPKLEAVQQCSGEAIFINDMEPRREELFGIFVTTKVANAIIQDVDASKALTLPGVVAFITAKDVPGVNNYMPFGIQPEPIFAKEKSNYAGQPVGLLVAKSRLIAKNAVRRVKIAYKNPPSPPELSFDDFAWTDDDALEKMNLCEFTQSSSSSFPRFSGVLTVLKSVKVSEDNDDKPKTIHVKGRFRSGSQYHFHMETQTCLCVPQEDHMEVFASTQWMDQVQHSLSEALALPCNYFNLRVTRIGGGYGGKLTRSAHVACATAVAAFVLNRPVRVVLDLETNMELIGGRLPYLTSYQADVMENGQITSLKATVVCDSGWSSNEITSTYSIYTLQSCYRANGWEIKAGHVTSHTAPKTYCRAPGSTEAIAAIETIMDHIAHKLGKDPLEIRTVNLMKAGDSILGTAQEFSGDNLIPSMLESLKTSADLTSRKQQVASFNQRNRWRKRGIAIVPMRYPVHTNSTSFRVSVVIYHGDGSVVVTHSGIEMGQGINTKVAQVVANQLKIGLEKIRIHCADNVSSGNCTMTGGAITSEYCCYAAIKACGILLKKIEAVKAQLKDPTWELLVQKCHAVGVDLKASYQIGSGDTIQGYDVWGVIATEVEVDCLTGENRIVRVDVIEDAGKSLSPDIDVGQVIGSLVMGFGLWLTEKYKYDQSSGKLLTNRTWRYKVPLVRDTPETFNVTLLKGASNPLGILSSKATGEPAVCMSCCVLMALRAAISSARADAGNADWFQLDGPATPEDILRLCLTDSSQFSFL